MSESTPAPGPQFPLFCWNELNTTDSHTALEFYTRMFGWTSLQFEEDGIKCTILMAGPRHAAGLVTYADEGSPPAWLYQGGANPTMWLPYVCVADVDATVQSAIRLGARVVMSPKDTPTVGRLAVFQDPQGALLGVFAPLAATPR